MASVFSSVASDVSTLDDIAASTRELDGLILAAGFEDRAFRVLEAGEFRVGAQCIIIRFQNDVPGNNAVFERYFGLANLKFGHSNVHIVDLPHGAPSRLESSIGRTLAVLPRDARVFGVDLSGQPAYAICMTLKALRAHRSGERQIIYYTAAIQYHPTKEEYDAIGASDEIELLPRSMALEMSENLSLDAFSGYRSQNARSCLAILAGYEVHRSTGVVEAVNPSLLLLMYGNPGDDSLSWRLDLSKRLHRKFERGRRTASEVVSTLHVNETLEMLERYYDFLIDDYDMVVAPIGSKMHSLAAYLFWERYGEIRLTFPLPIGYDPEIRPEGAGVTYEVTLEPQRPLFLVPAS
ncbi:hypothetical protein B0I00_2732 [Novosphingobium kunmingense]|uniref:Uncharacterized protein n=1 Tax=Novosphingobium kunmingense TaxID=1211806 RepID=A0A2N0H5A3_9SPHN|nr:hypothetical protein [Novosphingobium kunmingense]PKB14103.1 hypothetical protein B0I00_2732 [Novosphingobium kunmingense]